MIRKASLMLAAPLVALCFVYPVHAATKPAAVCTIGTIGQNPAVTVLNITGSGYTAGHTYYGRIAQPDGGGTAIVLYQSVAGELFVQDENATGNLPAGTYTFKLWQSVAAYNSRKTAIASCSAVAP